MRLIDADRLKMNIESAIINNPVFGNKLKELAKMLVLFGIDNAPTIDPVKHGYWKNADSLDYLECCSCCGNQPLWDDEEYYEFALSAYCPHCGAKMDAKEEKK